MNIYILRNNQRFGPYQEHMLLSYVNQGVVLKQDKAIADGESKEQTVAYYLKKVNAFFEMFTSSDCVPKKDHYHKFIKSIFTDRKISELFKDVWAIVRLLWSILL